MTAQVIELPQFWRVRWVDVEGYQHASLYRGGVPAHVAELAVATRNDKFYEFIGQPRRVVR